MKITDLVGGKLEQVKEDPYNLLDGFSIWTTKEEEQLLEKLKKPVKLSSLNEQEQFRVQAMIRKSLIIKVGMTDPTIVANEKYK